VPEQEYLPPRPPARFHRPDGPDGYPEEDAPPWANLPPVRSSRPAGDRPPGSWSAADPPAPPGSREQVPARGRAGRQAARGRAGRQAAGGRAGRQAAGGRALRAAARRRRRWLIVIAGLVIVAGGVIAAVVVVPGGPAPAPVVPGGLITTFQPGELQAVPDACGTVPAATVQQYLPGKAKQASPLPIDGSAESACDWTVDRAPVYRLLELNLLAYAPSGLASGDGSATYAAIDAYAQTLQGLQYPPRDSADPRAAIATLSGLGNEAFSATQVFRRGGAVTDVATVVVRYHNVIVTATLNGLDHSNHGSYGPVSLSELSSAALAFAQAGETALH
jgi:hypothetical protein